MEIVTTRRKLFRNKKQKDAAVKELCERLGPGYEAKGLSGSKYPYRRIDDDYDMYIDYFVHYANEGRNVVRISLWSLRSGHAVSVAEVGQVPNDADTVRDVCDRLVERRSALAEGKRINITYSELGERGL